MLIMDFLSILQTRWISCISERETWIFRWMGLWVAYVASLQAWGYLFVHGMACEGINQHMEFEVYTGMDVALSIMDDCRVFRKVFVEWIRVEIVGFTLEI